MAIEKLSEFAKDGQKNTDDLNLTDGFPVSKKPARQWFNWLFNSLTSKVNEIIDADFVPKADIVDNLTTDDAKRPVSAKQAKKLQDEKFAIADLVNNLTSGGEDKALTAEQAKLLFNMFKGQISSNGCQPIPNPLEPTKPLLLQWFSSSIPANQTQATLNFPISFTTESFQVYCTDAGAGAKSYGAYPISLTQYVVATSVSAGGSYFKGWAIGY